MLLDPSLKIPCVILPGWKFELLLPSTAVVEVLPPQTLHTERRQENILAWLEWREHRIPVVDFDGWQGPGSHLPAKLILAVVRLPTLPPRYLALPLRDKPRLLNASQRNLDTDFQPPRSHPLAKMYARSQKQSLLLVDWQQLAQQLSSLPA